MRTILILILVLAALPGSEARQVVLGTIEQAVIPAYDRVVAAAADLATASAALRDAPDGDHLAAARAAWDDAKTAWERAQPLTLGPAWLRRYRVDFWPTREQSLQRELLRLETVDHAAVAEFGSATKGFPALGWALFAGTDADVLGNARRLAYAAAAATVLHEDLQEMRAQWDGADDAARLAMVAATGGRTMPAATAQDALDGLVGALLATTSEITGRQIEKPIGPGGGKGPYPDQAQSRFAGRGLVDLGDNLAGVRAGLLGAWGDERTGSSIAALLDRRVDGAGRAVVAACDAAAERVRALDARDVAAVIGDDPARLTPLLQAARLLKVELKTRAHAVLGCTIYFGDSDGD